MHAYAKDHNKNKIAIMESELQKAEVILSLEGIIFELQRQLETITKIDSVQLIPIYDTLITSSSEKENRYKSMYTEIKEHFNNIINEIQNAKQTIFNHIEEIKNDTPFSIESFENSEDNAELSDNSDSDEPDSDDTDEKNTQVSKTEKDEFGIKKINPEDIKTADLGRKMKSNVDLKEFINTNDTPSKSEQNIKHVQFLKKSLNRIKFFVENDLFEELVDEIKKTKFTLNAGGEDSCNKYFDQILVNLKKASGMPIEKYRSSIYYYNIIRLINSCINYANELEKNIFESAPPSKDIENFINFSKKKFKKKYGKYWKNILYATAWKMYNQKKKNR